MSLELMTVCLIIGNFFVLTGLFITILFFYTLKVSSSNQLKEFQIKLEETTKTIEYLTKMMQAYDVTNLFVNSLYSSTSQQKKNSTSPKNKFPFAVIKKQSEDEQVNNPKQEKE